MRPSSLLLNHRKGQRRVRRKPYYAAIFQLNLRLAVIPGRNLRSRKERHIGQRRIGQNLPILHHLHMPLHAAQPQRPRISCACGSVPIVIREAGRSGSVRRQYRKRSRQARCQQRIA